jgi:hypothetical protein
MKASLLVFSLVFVVSCTNPSKIPEGVLSKQKMEVILWDLIQADRFSASFLMRDSTKTNIHSENMKLYQRVFQMHKISKEEFEKSFKFYLSRPDITKIMFDSIAVKAERQRPSIYTSDSVNKNLPVPIR